MRRALRYGPKKQKLTDTVSWSNVNAYPTTRAEWRRYSESSGPCIYCLACDATGLVKFGKAQSLYSRWRQQDCGPTKVRLIAALPWRELAHELCYNGIGEFVMLETMAEAETMHGTEQAIHRCLEHYRARAREW